MIKFGLDNKKILHDFFICFSKQQLLLLQLKYQFY